MRSILALVGFVLAAFVAGAVGARFTPGAWYAELTKPSWNPPSWVFGPVWSTLYLLMGIAAWLVWKRAGFGLPLLFWGLQLVVNALWSYLFFGLQRPDLALIDIVLLLGLIVATLAAFRPVSPVAAALLLPYLLWVAFATALNLTLWRLNP
jgi:tryptophan-rich sensory protein